MLIVVTTRIIRDQPLPMWVILSVRNPLDANMTLAEIVSDYIREHRDQARDLSRVRATDPARAPPASTALADTSAAC